MRNYIKKKVKDEGLAGPGGIRINNAGCLERCGQGPILVIYPEETWYQYKTKGDIDEIFEQHIVNGKNVKRLAV